MLLNIFLVSLLVHSNAGDVQPGSNGGAYASLSSACFSRLAREEYLTVASGLSVLITQADALCSPVPDGMPTTYHADAFVPLIQVILAGLASGPARSGPLAADAAALSASEENSNLATPAPIFSDERFTDVAGESGLYLLIIEAYD